ncbi:putative Ku family DNA helicase [Viridothelium virens]|uniref:ATP-dependent DNA helicase II subunit 2 n=1 Tax=Viridothelium virens TaxID=1048519 RepID=A0A6A6HH14_VIRVR|nr:putative Ku family DNA helicase [Viridothelium virens]
MATKEATVFIIDIGKSMSEHNGGRNESDLQWAMHYIWDRVTSTVATGRKTAQIGVIALRSDETNHDLSGEEGYQHISILQPISQILMTNLRDLRGLIKSSNTENGDALSALVIAIQMIASHCKKLQYVRQIVLVTNGRGAMDTDDLPDIAKKLLEDSIELLVVGVDFDDLSYGYKEEEKTDLKRENEKILKGLTEQAGGIFGTLAQATEELGMPRVKSTRPVPSYKGPLTLGDTGNYDTALSINVERYPRTMVAAPPSASSFAVKSDSAPDETSAQSSATVVNGDTAPSEGSLAAVNMTRVYQIQDESAPGGKRDVDREELAKGYTYGRKAVPISESEENVTKFETSAGFEIIGFVPAESHQRFTDMSRTNVIIAQKTDEKQYLALSSFIHALHETDSFAVARLVAKENRPPLILILAPSIEPDCECLIDVEIPFAEDIRSYRFPPLDRIITVSGKTLTQHRNLPNDALTRAMDGYVDHMDLSLFDRDEEGNPTEYLPMDETYSPVLHRLHQAIRWRAVHPMEAFPPPPAALTRASNPPEELIKAAKPFLDKVQATGDVKKVPPKQLSRKRARDTIKPLSGLDVDALLHQDPSKRRRVISSENAIPDFKQLLASSEDPNAIADAARQMGARVQEWIERSLGDSGYGRAIEGIRVMREELSEFEEPGLYNEVMRGLKERLMKGELGGDRAEMWWLVRVNRLGLIDRTMSARSEVDEEEAKRFLAAK